MTTFNGFVRPDGRVGVRNLLCVVATSPRVRRLAKWVASRTGGIAVADWGEDGRAGADLAQTRQTLTRIGQHPNVGAVIYVGAKGDPIPAQECKVDVVGKPVAAWDVTATSSLAEVREQAVAWGLAQQEILRRASRVEVGADRLWVGLNCGGSDATSGIASNPAVGAAMDLLVREGGAVTLGEMTGLPGSEQALAARARSKEIAEQIYRVVDKYRMELRERFNTLIEQGNPGPGNIEGGITTLAEKSIGNIMKGGSSPIEGVIPWAEPVPHGGLWIMDTPGHDPVAVSGQAAGGAQIVVFTTGRGTPVGNALAPVIKVCANPETVARMGENIDLDASGIVTGRETVEEVGRALFELLIEVANGRLTKAEELGHTEFAIARVGSSV